MNTSLSLKMENISEDDINLEELRALKLLCYCRKCSKLPMPGIQVYRCVKCGSLVCKNCVDGVNSNIAYRYCPICHLTKSTKYHGY